MREKNIIANPLSPVLEQLAKSLHRLAGQLSAKSKGDRAIMDDPQEGEKLSAKEYEIEKSRFELQSYIERVHGLANTLNALLTQEIDKAVYWVEATGKTTRRLKWTGSPIQIADELREHLFGQVKSVILTSATLAAGGAGRGEAENAAAPSAKRRMCLRTRAARLVICVSHGAGAGAGIAAWFAI